MDFNLLIWLGEKLGLSNLVNESTIHIVSAAFIAVVLIILAVIIKIRLRDPEKFVIPSEKFNLIGVFDIIVEWVLGLMEGVMGERAIKFLPLVGSVFLYIFFCNLLSLIPGFLPPTDNINTNLPVAVTVFVYYHAVGVKEHGVKGYLKHFAGPIIWLAPLMFSLEIISHCVRPISLSVRLFGNITGDHMVLGIFSNLIPLFVPVIFLALALFVAFIQAFVFSLLSTVYIALATEKEH